MTHDAVRLAGLARLAGGAWRRLAWRLAVRQADKGGVGGIGGSTPTNQRPETSEALPGTRARRSSAECALDEMCAELGDEEMRVLAVLARRLLAGQRTYGVLDLANDRRDWRRERGEEFADALVYGAFAEVAATLARGVGR